MKIDYIKDDEIEAMANAAFVSYEFTCSWKRAGEAAREFAMDEFGKRPSSGAVGLAVRLAQVKWESARMRAAHGRA